MKYFLLLSLTVLLTSCGGSGAGDIACDQDYWDGTVGTCLPSGWDIISQEVLRQRGVPEETIAAFQKTQSVSGQFPTVAVTREVLPSVMTAADYSEASIRSIQFIDGYTLVDQEDFSIDGESVDLHIFTAQPIEGEPSRRFYQISTSVGDVGYTATAVAPISVDSALEDEMQLILQQLTFVAPEEE